VGGGSGASITNIAGGIVLAVFLLGLLSLGGCGLLIAGVDADMEAQKQERAAQDTPEAIRRDETTAVKRGMTLEQVERALAPARPSSTSRENGEVVLFYEGEGDAAPLFDWQFVFRRGKLVEF
jgi:hypothetical protein